MSIKSFVIGFLFCAMPAVHAWQFPWQNVPTAYIVIAPAGDAQNPGRTIYDTVERSITFQWAQALKNGLEECIARTNVSLTRVPGQTLAPLATAQLANRLSATLVISLHCYEETQQKPSLAIYHFSTGQEFITAFSEFHAFPLEQAYLASSQKTEKLARQLSATCKLPAYQTHFTCAGPYKLPLTPLLGIKVPAIAIELGIKQGMAWEPIIQAVVQSIKIWLEALT